MQVPSIVLQALSEILAVQSPQFAARLKQRLTAALESKGEDAFDERKFGFKGFRHFLTEGTQGLFVIAPSPDGADIVVSLQGATGGASTTSSSANETGSSIRKEVWQAFTNPDQTRLRFLNRRTHVVRHYLRGEESPPAQEVAAARAEFVEIQPISGDDQVGWMRQFIEQKNIGHPLHDVLEGIIAKPYTSGVNAAFTGALQDDGLEWRQDRVQKIIQRIAAWSKANDVPMEYLSSRHVPESAHPPATHPNKPVKVEWSEDGVDGVKNPRVQAERLLGILTNDEISRVVLPVLLSTLLMRGKA